MANSKINTVNVGGVDFQIQAASGSSDAGFVDDTIEAALKKLIDSFNVEGTYTGRFKATNTPNKWFSYQIDLFDTIASGYIVNTIDPEESYTVGYRTQTDEQATISSIGKTITEHEDAISQINNDLTEFLKTQNKTSSSVNVNSGATATIAITPDTIDGYTVVGIVGYSVTAEGVILKQAFTNNLQVFNNTSSAKTTSVIVTYLYIRNMQ